MAPTTSILSSGNVKALHVRAASSPDGSVYGERFGQRHGSTVDANMAETAVEGRNTDSVDATWWTQKDY